MAIQEYSGDEIKAIEAEARYYLGRLLYEGKLDYDRAVSELEESLQLDPSYPPVGYHLARAIQEQIEQNKLRRARALMDRYLQGGATHGHEPETRDFLGTRQSAAVEPEASAPR